MTSFQYCFFIYQDNLPIVFSSYVSLLIRVVDTCIHAEKNEHLLCKVDKHIMYLPILFTWAIAAVIAEWCKTFYFLLEFHVSLPHFF